MMLENRLSFSTSSLKKWFLRLTFSGLVIGAMVAPQTLIASSTAQEARPRDGSKISLLVEKGFVLPPQSLTTLMSLDGSSWERRPFTTFTISGGASFESQIADGTIAIVPTENGVIKTPTIIAGPQFGEGFIQVLVDDQPIIENLRVATLEVGDIEKLKRYVRDGDPALPVSGDHYAALDESKVTSQEAVSGRGANPVVTWPGPTWTEPTGKDPTKQEEAALPSVQHVYLPTIGAEPLGVCIRTPFGPGKVNWHFPFPADFGYMIKPESINRVRYWASAPSDDIDGIYRRSWGCGVALKVPNSCTIDWYADGSWTYCCNAAAWVAGKRLKWIREDKGEFAAEGFLGCQGCPSCW